MAGWLNLGQNLKVNAKKFPNTVALKDRMRTFTYPQVNRRVNKLAHSLLSIGLSKGDKVAVLLENSIEIVELYLATDSSNYESWSNELQFQGLTGRVNWILGFFDFREDNAIVVLENMVRLREDRHSLEERALTGTKKMTGASIASTLGLSPPEDATS